MQTLASGGDVQAVRGVASRVDGVPRASDDAVMIANLDDYRIGWELIDHSRYSYWGGKRAVVRQFSRGCPHLCSYCGQRGFWTQWRHRNPEKLANYVYAGRMGNTEPGDGWRYRGRGLIQITLKNNYRACGQALGLDLLNHPDLLLDPVNAARSAAWYWYQHGCNAPADAANVVEVTRKINPALVGLNDRAMLFEKARRALCPSKN